MDSVSRRAALLVRLFHHRWTAPALARTAASPGVRFAYLARSLGAPPASLRTALDSLLALGLIRRNPGYGHPLRPEYVVRAAGRRAGTACADLLAALGAPGVEEIALRKWSLPILDAIASGRSRFSEIEAVLPGVTPRALALGIKGLCGAGLVERQVRDAFPPVPVYGATAAGRRIAAKVDAVVRAAAAAR